MNDDYQDPLPDDYRAVREGFAEHPWVAFLYVGLTLLGRASLVGALVGGLIGFVFVSITHGLAVMGVGLGVVFLCALVCSQLLAWVNRSSDGATRERW